MKKKPYTKGAKVKPEVLPSAFVEYWRALCARNVTGKKAAWRDLLRRWHRGESIPGYPNDAHTGIPRGWSFRNLIRYAPKRNLVAAAKIAADTLEACGLLLCVLQNGAARFDEITGEFCFRGLCYWARPRDWNRLVETIGREKLLEAAR